MRLKLTLMAASVWLAATATTAIAAKPAEPAPEMDDPAKFFLFHAGDQSADQFRGDLVYCIGQAYPILSMRDRMPSTGGIFGALLEGRMAEIDRFRMRNAAMRKCMGGFGYARFQVPQDRWNEIVKNGDIVRDNDQLVDAEVVENMVGFATAAAPSSGRLEP